MTRSGLRWRDLRDGTATIFLVLLADNMAAYSCHPCLLVAQNTAGLARASQRAGIPPVLKLLDEFATLGRLKPGLPAVGLQLWYIFQDMNQFRVAYGESASIFLVNVRRHRFRRRLTSTLQPDPPAP